MSDDDRELARLLAQGEVTGLASVEVSSDRWSLDVRFHIAPTVLVPPWDETSLPEQILVTSAFHELTATSVSWSDIDGERVLTVELSDRVGFSTHRLRIDHERIDPAFRELSFRATVDRLQSLLAQRTVTGIDFVRVHDDQQTLDVYFHHDPDSLDPTVMALPAVGQIRIVREPGGGGPAVVPVSRAEWVRDTSTSETHGRQVLRIATEFPGGFSLYRLFVDDDHIDPYFNGVLFSFKAVCESDLDCAPPAQVCPPEDEVDVPIDYQARDFWSLRRALFDFASQRYPDWKDRLEADAGVMLAEVMSALGDELAYYQDRVGREAHLETATQRRSVRHHARLVDYEMHDGLAGSTWLDVTVSDGTVLIAAGTDVWAESDGGERIDYEVGLGLNDRDADGTPTEYEVSAAANSLEPYIWDEDDTCLPVGATGLDLLGDQSAIFPAAPVFSGRWVLLKTNPFGADQPQRRWLVRVVRAEVIEDALTGESVTRLQWEEAQALPFEIDLTVLEVRANLVPATAGRTYQAFFVIGMEPDDPLLDAPEDVQPTLIRAVERQGRLVSGREAGACTQYLCSLPMSDEVALCWLGEETGEATPEIRLQAIQGWDATDEPIYDEDDPWTWRRSLVGTFASQSEDRHFTLEDGIWRRVVGYQRIGQEIVHRDYASGDGVTVRFGDGELGQVPERGSALEVTYRLGNGRRGNVAADALTHFDADGEMPAAIAAVTNPLPVTNGLDAESLADVRRLAPDAFRAITYRAVRPEDYAEAAERLPWVQRADAAFRWTGSWVTAFVTADPRGAMEVTEAQDLELARQIDRFRQAGREAYTADPRYADIDLEITVCVEPFAYVGQVKERVLAALLGAGGATDTAFFDPDHFSFGTPLWRSRLEARIQAVEGVRAVTGIRIRRRGVFDWRPLTGPHYPVGQQEVIRVENDPDYPERGTLELITEGGA